MVSSLQRLEKMNEIAERMLSAYKTKQPFSVTAEEHQVFFEESLKAAGSNIDELLAAKERYEKRIIARHSQEESSNG